MLGLGTSIISEAKVNNVINTSENSISFDGTGDYISFTETSFAIDDADDDLTISFWAKRTDNSDEAVVLGNSGTSSLKRLYFNSAGNKLYIESDKNSEEAYATVTADTDWHHYAITVAGADGDEATVKIYEDGSSSTVTNDDFGNVNDKDFTVDRIGADQIGGTTEFKGLLYQIAIYDATLSSSNVSAIYNSGSPTPLQSLGTASNLIHLWKFSEGSGSTTSDNEGSLTGTIVNATWSTTTP